MFPDDQFKLTRKAALLAAICAGFAGEAMAASAGRVDFVAGAVQVTGADGVTRPLARGSEVGQGDTINTNDGRAQIRFTDGAYVSLQPQSQFKIDEYRYEGKSDGQEKGFFSLLKGAMRTITGAVGRVNRSAYRVYTPSATIGIRGTEYLVKVSNPTEVFTANGLVEMCNNGGCILVFPGQTGFAANSNTTPQQVGGAPVVGAPPPGTELPEFTVADQNVLAPFGGLPSEPGYAMLITYFDDEKFVGEMQQLFPNPADPASGLANFDSVGLLASYVNGYIDGGEGGGGPFFGPYTLTSTGSSYAFTDGVIGWGRWDSGIVDYGMVDGGEGGESSFPMRDVHYIIGKPTPASDMEAMRSGGVRATYTYIGSTYPTGSDGGVGQFLGGTLTADFSGGEVGVNFQVRYGGHDYTTNGYTSIYGSRFREFTGSTTATGGGCGSSGCSTDVEGLFVGQRAARAGMTYLIKNYDKGIDIGGAAAFTKGAESRVLP